VDSLNTPETGLSVKGRCNHYIIPAFLTGWRDGMNQRIKQLAITLGVIIVTIILVLWSLPGSALLLGLFLICIIWAIYFVLMTR
jgi:hypothetical protein